MHRSAQLLSRFSCHPKPERYASQLARLRAEGCWEAVAYRLIALERYQEVDDLADKVRLTAHNRFLLLGTRRHGESVARLKDGGDLLTAAEIMLTRRQFAFAAEIFEAGEDFERAARFYAKTGDHKNAARICEIIGKYNDAGEFLLKAGQAEAALAMFVRAAKPRKRSIAKTLEKLGRYDEAVEIWRGLGDLKAAERCFRLNNKRRLF